MTVKVNREKFIALLDSVHPGIAPREIVEQSTSYIFQKGSVASFNDEVSCRAPSPLPEDFTGAVPAEPLLEILRKLTEDELRVEPSDSELVFVGKRRRAGIRLERDIALPLDSVEPPGDWRPLPEEFGEAVAMVQACAGQDESQQALVCVHVHPKWVEACQPPGTLVMTSGGEVPIEMIEVGQHVWSYSYQQGKTNRVIVGANKDLRNKFKHGHLVTNVGRRQYVGDLVVVMTGNKSTRYTVDHECLVRLDSAFKKKYAVYMLQRGLQFRVGVTGPRMWKGKWANPRRNGRTDVRTRLHSQKADRCWVLACFDTEAEALMEERFIVARYGIPDMLFRVRPGENHSGSQERCDYFWKRFGENMEGAKFCLMAYGRELDFPFAEREHTKYLSHMGDVEIKVRACNLLVGMKVLDAGRCKNGRVTSKCWVPFALAREAYNGPVYSMSVDRSHTYIGDGIVTHNCDNFQLCRWRLATGFGKPTLVRQSAIKHVTGLGMMEVAESAGWVHFRNAAALVLSCRRYLEDYPSLAAVLKADKGEAISLPKGLAEEADKAEIFSKENADANHLLIDLAAGKLKVAGTGVSGWYRATRKVVYAGPPLRFLIAPGILRDLVKKHSDCLVSPTQLRVEGGSYTFISCLFQPQNEEDTGTTEPEAMEGDGEEETPRKRGKKAAAVAMEGEQDTEEGGEE